MVRKGSKGFTHQKIILFAESEEMSKQGIEVAFCAEVDQMFEVRVIHVGKNTQELTVDLFCDCWEARLEIETHCLTDVLLVNTR